MTVRLIAVECLILDTAIERLIGGQIVVSMRNDKGFLVCGKMKGHITCIKKRYYFKKDGCMDYMLQTSVSYVPS